MKYGVYSIRDARTGFLPPTVDQNDSSAMRNFAHACMQKESLLFSHIEDYALCKIGEFDNETGTISTQLPEVILMVRLFSERMVDIMYDEKLRFATQYRPRTRFPSNLGERERILYQPKFDENGVMDLVESGRENLYGFIQSHADSVDIHVLLARYQNGDVDALSRVQGAYGDFTNMPTSYAELLNKVNEGQSFFNSLPVDIRAKFNHNFAEFMAGMDKPDFLDKLGIKPEREPDQSQEVKPAVEPKKEVAE